MPAILRQRKIYEFFVKQDDLRVPYGRGEKPDSEKSVDVRSKERFMSKSFLPQKNKLKAVKENKVNDKPSVKEYAKHVWSSTLPHPERFSGMDKASVLTQKKKKKYKASVKVYTRRVGEEVFWDKKLERHPKFKEFEMDPEVRRELREYKSFREYAESLWDSIELEHPATFEELGMDPKNKGIISDFFGIVRDKEFCKRMGRSWRMPNCLVYDSPGTKKSLSIITAMANYLKYDIYYLDLTSFSSFDELKNMLLSTRKRSVITIEGLYHCAGKLLNLKTDEYAVKNLLNKIDALFLRYNNERIFVFTTNHRDHHDAASLRPLKMDIYIHTSLPQPIALPDGEKRTYHNNLLAFDSTKRYSLPNFDAIENNAVKVYSRRGRDCSHSMELEQSPTFAQLGNDLDKEGIISDFLSFVRDKELYKRTGKTWRRGYLLYDSPGTDRSGLIAAMANYLKFDIYDFDVTGLSSITELKKVVANRNRSLIAIKNSDPWFGMPPDIKNEVLSLRKENEFMVSFLSEYVDMLLSSCGDELIIVFTANHIDPHAAALLLPVDMDTYIQNSSTQPVALPDEGETMQLDSSEQKPLVNFDATSPDEDLYPVDATNNGACQSDLIVSNSEVKNTTEALKGQCMMESVLGLVDSKAGLSSTDFDAADNRAYLVSAHHSTSPMGLKQPATFLELATDTENEGIISNLLQFVRDKEYYQSIGKAWKRGYLLYNPPGIDRSSLMAAMAIHLEFDIYDLDLTGLSSISELTNVLVYFRNRSLVAIKDFDHWFGMLSNLKNELTGSNSLEFADGLLSSCGDEQIIVFTTNNKDLHDAALRRPFNKDMFIHKSSTQPVALQDEGEIVDKGEIVVQLDLFEQKPLVDFDATNNKAQQSGILVPNLEKESTRETSDIRCMTDSTTIISSMDFGAPENIAHLLRAHESGPIAFISEKKDMTEKKETRVGLGRECSTECVFSLDDSTKHKPSLDFYATENKAHMIRACESGPVVFLSENKSRGEVLKSDCITKSIHRLEDLQQLCGGRRDDAAKRFDAEQGLTKLPRYSGGSYAQSASSSRWLVGLPDGAHIVLLDPLEQSTQNTLQSIVGGKKNKWARRKGYSLGGERTFEFSSVSMDDILDSRLLFIHMPQFSRSSPQTSALPDGGKIFGPVALSSSELAATNNRAHDVRQDQSGHTTSLYEWKSTRVTSGRPGIAMSLCSVKDLQQHLGCKHKDVMKRLGVNRPMFKSTFRQHQIYWPPCWFKNNEARIIEIFSSFERKAFDATNKRAHLVEADQRGPTVSNLEKETMREASKRKCITKSVLISEDLRQHYGGGERDAAKSLCDSLVRNSVEVLDVLPLWEESNTIEHLVPRRRLALQQRWIRPKKSLDLPRILQMNCTGGLTVQSASSLHWPIGLPARGHVVSLSKRIIMRKTFKRECRTISVSFEGHQQHFGSRCEGVANSPCVNRICEQHGISLVPTVKRIHRQHRIHRLPFRQLTVSCLLKYVEGLFSRCGDERIIVFTTNHRDRNDAALVPLVNMDSYIPASSPQPIALPDGGEIVQLESSEQKPLVDFDATNNRECHSGILVSSSKNNNKREASKRLCMTESVLSVVDPTTGISLTELDATNNRAHLVRACEGGSIMSNSEKKNTGEGLKGDFLTKSVLSLDDSAKQKSLPDCDATENEAHLLIAYQSCPVVNRNRGDALKRECITKSILGLEDLRQHSGGRCDNVVKSFAAVYDPGIHTKNSLARKSFEVVETLRSSEQPSNATDTEREREIWTHMCLEQSDARGAHSIHVNTYARQFWAHLFLSLCYSVCVRSIFWEPDDFVPSSLRRLTLKGCVRKQKSPYLPRLLQIIAVEPVSTKSPRFSGGSFAKKWATRKGHSLGEKRPYEVSSLSMDLARSPKLDCSGGLGAQSAVSLPDGGYVLSVSEKKIVGKTLKRKCKTMSLFSLEDDQQHGVRRWGDAAKSLGRKRICRQLVVQHVPRAKHIHRQHVFHRWPFQQNWETMKAYSVRDKRPAEVLSLSTDGKLVSGLQLGHISWLVKFLPWPSAYRGGGEIVGPIALLSSEFAAPNDRAHGIRNDQSGSSSASHFEEEIPGEPVDVEGTGSGISLDELQQLFDKKREDAAKSLKVSVSTFKRICRQHGIKPWPYQARKKAVKKPPDRHRGMNTTGSSDDRRNLSASQEEPLLRGHVSGPIHETIPTCTDPAPGQPTTIVPHPTGNLLASEEEVLLRGHVSGPIYGTNSSCTDPAPSQTTPIVPHPTEDLEDQRNLLTLPEEPLPSQITPSILPTMDDFADWSAVAVLFDDSFPEGHASGSLDCTAPTCSNPAPSQTTPTNATEMLNMDFVELKATYDDATFGNTTIKFQLPPKFETSELEEKVSKILKCKLDSFRVEYKDKDDEWILMGCDENVREYLQLLNSLGKRVTKLKITKDPNITNLCETCGSSLTRKRSRHV